jgi:hypothetical protein
MSAILMVVHECTEFSHWKANYDADSDNRKAAGLTDLLLLRLSTNPNVIALVFGVGDHAKAKALVTSPQLHDTMQRAGIIGTPDVHFRQGDFSTLRATNYLTLNCRIRDIETFRKGHAMDRADRQDASLTDLALMQDVDDGNDLLLVWSVSDVAKATTFLASPTLAAHQVKNAGVVSPPVLRFWTE